MKVLPPNLQEYKPLYKSVQLKMIFSTELVVTQKNRLNETVLLSTQTYVKTDR